MQECRTVENIETVRLSVIEDPKKSYRKRAQALNMKPTSLLTIQRKDFKKIPYKCHTVQNHLHKNFFPNYNELFNQY